MGNRIAEEGKAQLDHNRNSLWESPQPISNMNQTQNLKRSRWQAPLVEDN
jgi:hypothetical protein